MIRHSRKIRFTEASNKISSVNQLIDAIEEYCGRRYTQAQLENYDDMVSVHSQNHGGQHFLVCLEDDEITSYYYNLRSVVDDCVQSAAHALSGEDCEYETIMEELMTCFEESWTDELDKYDHITLPCTKKELFSFFDGTSESVDDYIINLADSYSSRVESLIESDDDEDDWDDDDDEDYDESEDEDDVYEENRTRFETRRPQRRFRRR